MASHHVNQSGVLRPSLCVELGYAGLDSGDVPEIPAMDVIAKTRLESRANSTGDPGDELFLGFG